jgi:hypothetical protein
MRVNAVADARKSEIEKGQSLPVDGVEIAWQGMRN